MKRLLLCVAVVCLGFTSVLMAQDAVKVDPKHYTVVSENDQMRILKVHYGPHEKSVMHSHPAGAAVVLSEAKSKFTFPGGKTEEMSMKPGQAMYTDAVTHLPENMSDIPMDLILVELKGKAGTTKTAAKPAAAKVPKT